jgi:1-aminocyclopropane-1-carboxylate deaminase/D-cysteine desulfhydrase-like pyridoxal-dependent ACC family enzyme
MIDAALKKFREIPRVRFGVYPSPVEEMPRLREALGGGPRLYIKREDYSGPGFGGNKVRKLEYAFAQAQAEGADCVITIGGLRSNHCRVTAAFAARLGLECHLVLNGAAPDRAAASTMLDELYGAKIHHVEARTDRVPGMQRVAADLGAQGGKPFEIALGASVPHSAIGFIHAAHEIAQGGVRFDAIFHSTSSAGTQAGLDVGLQLYGQDWTKLIGVSADDSSASIGARVAEIREGIAELLGIDRHAFDRKLEVDDLFVGEGYGIPTEAGAEAIALLAKTEGVVLDPVYTSKAMAALIGRVRAGAFSESQRVLFLHTGGQLALFSA